MLQIQFLWRPHENLMVTQWFYLLIAVFYNVRAMIYNKDDYLINQNLARERSSPPGRRAEAPVHVLAVLAQLTFAGSFKGAKAPFTREIWD